MLKDSLPAFYEMIDSDPTGAGNEFCRQAMGYMNQYKPQFLRYFHPQEQDDIKQEICLHFIEDNLRVLRQYRPTGKDFGAWFYVSAHNKVRDILRKRKRQVSTSELTNDEQSVSSESTRIEGARTDSVHDVRDLLQTVNKLIQSMDKYCQLLIRMSGDEFKPAEMARVLRWPKEKAKKISDDLSYCREKLLKMLNSHDLAMQEEV